MQYRLLVTSTLLAAAGACLDEPPADGDLPEPMCLENTDCDVASGESCDVGICWGDPPANRTFGAVLLPPDERDDLVPTELSKLEIARAGDLQQLVFADSIAVSGRVIAATAPDRSIGAQIKVRRGSAIRGGPDYARSVAAIGDVAAGEPSFSVRLPRLSPGDAPYELLIIPDDDSAGTTPPARIYLDGTADTPDQTLTVGDPAQLKRVAGRVVDATGMNGTAGIRVVALGRWSDGEELQRASSVATTADDGAFALWIPTGMGDTFDLLARPAAGIEAPTVRVRDVKIPDPRPGALIEFGDLVMPAYSTTVAYDLEVKGSDTGGGTAHIAGAEVRLWTVLVGTPDGEPEAGITAIFSASGVTDANGVVTLNLLPGGPSSNRSYLASVLPVPDSEHAALWAHKVEIGPPGPSSAGNAVVEPLELDFRIQVSARVLTHRGEPASNAAVSSSAALEVRWELPDDRLPELDAYRFPVTTTDEDGRFLLWLDGNMLGVTARYDLNIAPDNRSRAPNWSLGLINPSRDASEGVLDLGPTWLPAAAFARGHIVDASGTPVAGAQLKIYEIGAAEVCQNQSDCVPPARLRTVAQSGEVGEVTVVLPDP